MAVTPLVLASASPRRAALLAEAGLAFEVLPVDLDESVRPGETPETHVRRLAEAKARAGLARRPSARVLGADTVVVLDGGMLGKPRDDTEARTMLRALAGRAHEVLTGVALVSAAGAACEVARTRVWFRPLSQAEIDAYVRSGEPADKAGAYGIQGGAARFVERLEGSYTNVVGLPMEIVRRLLAGPAVHDNR